MPTTSILRRRPTTQTTTQKVDPRYLTGGTTSLTPQSTAPAPQPTVATPGGTPVNTTPAPATQPNTARNVAQTLTSYQQAAQPVAPVAASPYLQQQVQGESSLGGRDPTGAYYGYGGNVYAGMTPEQIAAKQAEDAILMQQHPELFGFGLPGGPSGPVPTSAPTQPTVPGYTPTSYQVQPGTAMDRITEAAGLQPGEVLRREDIPGAQVEMDVLTQQQAEEDRARAYQMYQLAMQNVGASPELQYGGQQLMQYAGGQLPPELQQASALAQAGAGQLPPEMMLGSYLAQQRAMSGGSTPELEQASALAMGQAGQIPEALQRGEAFALQNAGGGGFLGPDYLERQQAAIRDRGALSTQDAMRRLAEEQARRGVEGSSFGDLDRARLEQSAQLGIQQQLTDIETQTRMANQAAQEQAIQQLLGFGIAGGEAQRAGIGQLAGIGAQREAAQRGLLSDLLGYGTAGEQIRQGQISQLAGLGGMGEDIRSRNLQDLLGYGMAQQGQQTDLYNQLAQIYLQTQREPTDLSVFLEPLSKPRRKIPGQ